MYKAVFLTITLTTVTVEVFAVIIPTVFQYLQVAIVLTVMEAP